MDGTDSHNLLTLTVRGRSAVGFGGGTRRCHPATPVGSWLIAERASHVHGRHRRVCKMLAATGASLESEKLSRQTEYGRRRAMATPCTASCGDATTWRLAWRAFRRLPIRRQRLVFAERQLLRPRRRRRYRWPHRGGTGWAHVPAGIPGPHRSIRGGSRCRVAGAPTQGAVGFDEVSVASIGPATDDGQLMRVHTPNGEQRVSLRFAPEGDAHYMTCRATAARSALV